MHAVVAPGERTLTDLDHSRLKLLDPQLHRYRVLTLCYPHRQACSAATESLQPQPEATGGYLT